MTVLHMHRKASMMSGNSSRIYDASCLQIEDGPSSMMLLDSAVILTHYLD